MELERFGLCLAGVVLAMPGELSGAMKAAMKGMGVTDFSEATSQVTKDLLPLPMGLSAEEQDWIKWASGPSLTISRKWIQVRAASRRVWLWLVVFSLNLFHCGALNSAVRPGAMYATGPVSSPQAKALASLQDAVDFFLLPEIDEMNTLFQGRTTRTLPAATDCQMRTGASFWLPGV